MSTSDLSRPTHNLVCKQGETFLRTWLIKREDDVEDVTNWVAWMQVRKKSGAAVLTELATPERLSSPGVGRFLTTTGMLVGTLPASVTALFQPGSYVYDAFITDLAGVTYLLSEGYFQVEPRITGP